MKNHLRRVVITGLGVVAPNGRGKEAFWQALTVGLSGVRPIRRFDPSGLPARIAGEIADFDGKECFPAHELKKVDRSNLYAMAAGLMAVQDSGLDLEKENPERIGSAIGNSVGGIEYVDKEVDVMRDRGPRWGSPFLAIAFFSCGTNGLLSIRFGLKGPVLTFCNGNASGNDALGMAYRTVQSGRADVMLAGGTEAPLIPMLVGSLAQDGVLSQRNESPTQACRPFDDDADGMVLGEGAGLVILESLEHARARGACIYAEVTGYASGNSAFDALRPEPNGWGLVHTMRRAMQEARVTEEDVDVIQAQGLSLREFDEMEARCMCESFPWKDRAPLVTAVSSWTGNCLGALGGLQTVASALMLRHQAVPAIANLERISKRYPIPGVKSAVVECPVNVIVQNGYCFMGKNNTLVLRRFTS